MITAPCAGQALNFNCAFIVVFMLRQWYPSFRILFIEQVNIPNDKISIATFCSSVQYNLAENVGGGQVPTARPARLPA